MNAICISSRYGQESARTGNWIYRNTFFEVRIEALLAPEGKRAYPCCISGRRRAPPEDCGGLLAFMARRDAVPLLVADLFEEIRDHLETNDLDAIRLLTEDVAELREWLTLDSFDRRAVNRRLRQYATNDEAWMRHGKKPQCGINPSSQNR